MPLFAIAAEILIGEFLLPWGMVVSVLGFFAAWIFVIVMEHLRLTRHVANLPVSTSSSFVDFVNNIFCCRQVTTESPEALRVENN